MEDTTHTQSRIAVVDDHEMFRAGVIATLQPYFDIVGQAADVMFRAGVIATLQPYFDIVGQAADVESSIDMIVATQPDVVLLDVHVPGGAGGGGAERAVAVRRSWPNRIRTPRVPRSWRFRSPIPRRTWGRSSAPARAAM